MHTLALLLSLFVIDSLSILSPGPNILLVTQAAVEHSRRHAVLVAFGLAAAGLVWACVAVTGLTAIFKVLPSLQTTIRIAGGVYLLYLSVRLWRSRSAPNAIVVPSPSVAQPARKAFLRGFVTSLLNPKALAYFGSIFVLFVPADASEWVRWAAVAIVFCNALIWYGLAAVLFSTLRVVKGYMAMRRPIDRACAALMAVFGIKLMI